MIGKKFTSLIDGRVVEVKDAFEDIIILQDGSKIKSSRLMDRSFYDEYIDPNSFFQNQSLLNTFAQKIKQIPDDVLNKMKDEDNPLINESVRNNSVNDNSFRPKFDDPAILQADPEMEKLELMRKYGIKESSQQISPVVESQKQLEKFKYLIEELQNEEEEIQRIDVERHEVEQPINQNLNNRAIIEERNIVQIVQQEDPIITMFKNVKRVKDFKITVDIENKIPRPDFIEMMEDSYNISLIDFLSEEFTNQILQNPEQIKEKIKSEIKRMVYGEEIVKKVEVAKTTAKKTRTPRNKKISLTND